VKKDRAVVGRLVVALCVAAVVACSWLRPLDERAKERVSAGLQKALVTYGTARLLYGGISVLQGTQINAEPAGIGATFTPGQVLAPAAEMLKQFSDVMLLVCVAFGIQEFLIGIASSSLVSTALTAAALAWAWHLFRERPHAGLTKIFVILLVIQFAVPVAVLGSDQIFQRFLSERYQEAQKAVNPITHDTAKATPPLSSGLEKPGILDRLTDWFNKKSTNAVAQYQSLNETVEHATKHIIQLLAVFVLQTIILPLLLLWALYGITRAVLRLPQGPRGSLLRN